MEDYTKAINLDPNDAGVYSNRGAVYCVFWKYEEALADYTKAIDLDPSFADAYYNRANLYDTLGETALAQQDRETYARLTNTN
jgi:tetratricopeptide (TPR) repeat protein